MTIEIHKPELEVLIRERMKRGAFQNVEDVLLQALKSSVQEDTKPSDEFTHTGADLVAAELTDLGVELAQMRGDIDRMIGLQHYPYEAVSFLARQFHEPVRR